MLYNVLADIIVVIHCIWILFMLIGLILTLCGFFWKGFFDRWLFRTLHLFGIVYVGLLATLRHYCPLTILENILRSKYNPNLTYPCSFMVHYIEKFVYPDLEPLILITLTGIVALFTVIVFILRPPKKIKKERA